jgi:hypothetical protein
VRFEEGEEAEQELEAQRVEAYRKMKDCLAVLGVEDTFLKKAIPCALPAYSEWMNRNRVDPHRPVSDRNVIGVEILAEIAKTVEKDNSGSHCRILLGTFKLIMTISVNLEVNKGAE